MAESASRALAGILQALDRQQAEIDRASAEGERGLAARPPDPSRLVKHAEELRKQALTAIEALARTEEEIAAIMRS